MSKVNCMEEYIKLLKEAKEKTEKCLVGIFLSSYKEEIVYNLLTAIEYTEKCERFARLKQIAPELIKYSTEYKGICNQIYIYIEKAVFKLERFYDSKLILEAKNLLSVIQAKAIEYDIEDISKEIDDALCRLTLDNSINHNKSYINEYKDLLELIDEITINPFKYGIPDYSNIVKKYITKIERINEVDIFRSPLVMAITEKAIESINSSIQSIMLRIIAEKSYNS